MAMLLCAKNLSRALTRNVCSQTFDPLSPEPFKDSLWIKGDGQWHRGITTVNEIYMKRNSLSSILLGILAVSALANLVLCFFYAQNLRTFRNLQPLLPQIQQNRVIASSLVNDVVEYSKTHPDVAPILDTVMKRTPAALKTAGK